MCVPAFRTDHELKFLRRIYSAFLWTGSFQQGWGITQYSQHLILPEASFFVADKAHPQSFLSNIDLSPLMEVAKLQSILFSQRMIHIVVQ